MSPTNPAPEPLLLAPSQNGAAAPPAVSATEAPPQYLDAFIHAAQIAYWEWDMASNQVRVNAYWAQRLGYGMHELPANSLDFWFTQTHPDDVAPTMEQVQQCVRGERSLFDCELRLRHRAGHWVWMHNQGLLVQRDAGLQPLMCGTSTDISARKQAEAALRASEALLARSQQIAHIGSWRLDLGSGVLAWTDEVYRIFGVAPQAFGRSYAAFLQYVHPDDRAALDAAYQASMLPDGPAYDFVHRIVRADTGEVRWVHEECEHERDASGAVLASVGNVHEITEQRQAEERLQLAARVFEASLESILITDAQGVILDANPAFCAMTGYTLDEVRGLDPGLLASGLHDADFYRSMWQQLRQHGHWKGEIWNRRKNGEIYPERKVIQAVHDAHGRLQHYCSHGTDLSLVQAQKQQIERLNRFDALTGLANRQHLHHLLQAAMQACERQGTHLALVCLDLDDFKRVNDAHGAAQGDRLLLAFAQHLKGALRPGDALARLGGDEFALVLAGLSARADVRPPLERLLSAGCCSGPEAGTPLTLTASYGVTFYPQALAVDADQLLRQAQQALFDAKQGGKNRAQIFDTEQDQALRQRNHTLERIKLALQRGEFVLHYQPKVQLRSGAVLGVEALVRWQHPERGLLPPGLFLPALEGQNLMVELGHWVIDAALAQIECWRAAGLHLPVSVNVDALQLAQSDFVARLQAALQRHPSVPPCDLEIEILETSALGDLRQVCALLRACQDLGVQASLDDFGTGYSSLTHFKHLPVQTIKIDQSFVRDLLDNADNVPILRSVLDLSAAFGRLAIAEGVETIEHGELLLRLGCEHGQGYAIAKPMPARQVRDWVAQWQTPAAWASAPGQSAPN